MLQHAGNAEPAVFAALGGLAPALLETVVVGERQRLVEHGLELAAVDGRADGGLVRHRRRLDQVAPAQLDRIDAGHPRGLVDHALEDEVGLRTAGAAVGRRGRRVGEHAAHGDVDARDVVHAGQAAREVHGLDVGADGADEGAHAPEVADAQRQELAALVERKLDIAIGVACVIVAQERLGAVRHPMHRPADLARRDQDREVFRIGAGLQSEGAADILGDHPQALVGNAQDGGKSVAQRARTLRAAAQQIALVGRIVARGCAARLHRLHQDPLLDQSDPRHVPGGRDEAIDLLGIGLGVGRQSRPVDRDIARRFRPDLRRALANGLAQVDHRRTLLVVDGDELGAVLRGRQRLGDHDRDRLAHMAHGRAGEGGAMRNDELLAAPANAAAGAGRCCRSLPCRRRSAPRARRARPWPPRYRSNGYRQRRAGNARNRHRSGRSAGRRPRNVRGRAPTDRPPGAAGAARGYHRSLHPYRHPMSGRVWAGARYNRKRGADGSPFRPVES